MIPQESFTKLLSVIFLIFFEKLMWFITTLLRFLHQQLTNRKLLYCGNSGRVIRANYVIVISVLYKHLSSCTKFKSLESSGLISEHSRSSPKEIMNALVEERIFIALQWSEGRNQTCLVSSIKLTWQTNNLSWIFANILGSCMKLGEVLEANKIFVLSQNRKW